MNEEIKKLQELKASISQLDKKYRESKGYGEVCCDKPCPAELEDVMYQMVSNVYRYIDNSISYIWQWQDQHISNSTHLPKLTPSQIENLLEAAGAENDFDVQKRTIWAKNRQGNKELVVDLSKKK